MYNKNFRLGIEDIDLIEKSIDCKISSLINDDSDSAKKEIKDLHNLKGLLYNQKRWYRPKYDTYISG